MIYIKNFPAAVRAAIHAFTVYIQIDPDKVEDKLFEVMDHFV